MKRLLCIGVVCLVVNGGTAMAAPGVAAEPVAAPTAWAAVPDGTVTVTVDRTDDTVRPERSWAEGEESPVMLPGIRAALAGGQSVREALGTARVVDPGELVMDLLGRTESEGSASDVSEEESGEEPTATYRYLDVLADLNGDGTTDVAVGSYTYPAGTGATEARDGRSGAHLWTAPIDGGSRLEVLGDTDGDGAVELLATAIKATMVEDGGGCDEETCDYTYEAALISTVSVLDGASGQALWSEETAGSYRVEMEQTYTDDAQAYRYRESIELQFGEVSGDHDGDGIPEVLASQIGQAYSYAYDSRGDDTGLGLIHDTSEEEALTGTVAARVIRAGSGETLLDVHAGGEGQVAQVSDRLADVTGDGAADLQVITATLTPVDRECRRVAVLPELCSQDQTSSIRTTVDAVDGRDGHLLWSAPVDGYGFTIGGADLTGDGTQDLMLLSVNADGFTNTVVSGTTGMTVWSHSGGDWLFPLQREDLDGDGDVDLLTVSVIEDPGTYEWTIVLSRMDAATGQTWLETQPFDLADGAGECSFWLLYISGGQHDLDGDGPADPWGGMISEDLGPGCEGPPVGQSMAFVESGRSGAVVHRETSDTLRFTAVVDDLSGDGRADSIREELWAGGVTATGDWDGPQLWTSPAEWDFTYTLGADLDGTGGADVVAFQTVDVSGGWDQILRVRSGLDLSPIWQVGAE